MTLRPSTVPIPDSKPDDPRIGNLLGGAVSRPEEAECIIAGFPVDEGVRRNGGRAGAAHGPEAIRRCLYKMTPDTRQFEASVRYLERVVDLGDIESIGDLEADQFALGAALAPHLARGATVIVLGGGHETSFGHFLGYASAGLRVQVLNWDAHPDVRPLVDGKGHSGSPFRQILQHESNCCTGYIAAGLNPHSTARAHLDFLAERGCQFLFRDAVSAVKVQELTWALQDNAFVTFDLDALPQVIAPGVSAPNADGLALELWLLAAELAGMSSAVRSLDVVELCPAYDRDDQTARIAALTIWRFWSGRLSRGFARA